MRSGGKGTPQPDINAAYALYQQGKRDEAYKLINEILKVSPNHLQARALRDRMDTEELQQFHAQTRELQELGDVSPVAVWMILGLGVVMAAVGTYLGYKALGTAFNAGGLSQQVVTEGGGVLPGRSQAPAHVLLIYPVVFYLISGACFYTYRKYRAE